jgi:hypothetical protein
MTNWLAGMRITADRLNDNTLETSTTSGLVAATNFSVNSFSGRKVNGITTVNGSVQYTGAGINVTNPGDNIADTAICTLPTGWRPSEAVNCIWSDGSRDGEASIATSGVVTIRTTLNDITTSANLRFYTSWISENG